MYSMYVCVNIVCVPSFFVFAGSVFAVGAFNTLRLCDRTGVSSNRTGVSSNRTGVSSNRTGVSSNRTGVSSNRTGVSSNRTGISSNNSLCHFP